MCEQSSRKLFVYGFFEEGYGNFFVYWHDTGITKMERISLYCI